MREKSQKEKVSKEERLKITYARQLTPKGAINAQAMVSFEFEETEVDKVIEVIKKLEEQS
jgi:hypothetical protein